MIPRIVYPGESVHATAAFSDDNGKAVLPKDSMIYPVYRILNHNGEFVTGGIATLDTKSQVYYTDWQVPDYIELSQTLGMLEQDTTNINNRPYVIDWELVDTFNKQWNYRETFEVGNPQLNTQLKEQQHITLARTSLTLTIPVVRSLESENILFSLYKDKDENSVIWSGTPNLNGTYSTYYLYSITIPANVLVSDIEYIGVWEFSDSPIEKVSNNRNNDTYGYTQTGSTYNNSKNGGLDDFPVRSGDTSVFTQVIHCISLWTMKLISGMRQYIDKVMKNLDIYQGYPDSYLNYHLKRGAEILNGIGLITSWTLNDWKVAQALQGGEIWLVLAGCWSALKGQFLAEVDSSFDYSGQPVSLSVNRQGDIDSWASNIWDTLQNQFASLKNQIVKNNKIVGHLNIMWPTVSPFSYWGGFNRRSIGFGWNFGGWSLNGV